MHLLYNQTRTKTGYFSTHLIYSVENVLINVFLGKNSKGGVRGLVVIFKEQVLESHGILLLEGHHYLVAEAEHHQLEQRRELRMQSDEEQRQDEEPTRTTPWSLVLAFSASLTPLTALAMTGQQETMITEANQVLVKMTRVLGQSQHQSKRVLHSRVCCIFKHLHFGTQYNYS